jgi:hypothetical protein
MGVLRDEKQAGRKGPEFFTETVEKLWKNRRLFECKFGYSLRIWHFAQNFVNSPTAGEGIFYLIEIQSISRSSRSALIGFAREI